MPRPRSLTLRGTDLSVLKWIALGIFIVAFIGVQMADWWSLHSRRPLLNLILVSIVVLLMALVSHTKIFRIVEERERRLERRRREFEELRRAGLDIAADLSLDSVLQRITEVARELVQSQYAALTLIDEIGNVQSFYTAGPPDRRKLTLEDLPTLSELSAAGERPSGSHDSSWAEMLGRHPRIQSLLAEVLPCQSPLQGVLYVANSAGGSNLTTEDQSTLVLFASQAALAIDNAHSHRRAQDLAISEERLRISREMHDGVAQVLAYCNAKLQAVSEFLVGGRTEEARTQLEELARTSRDVYADVREGILGLRTVRLQQEPLDEALRKYVELWQEQSGITTQLVIDDRFIIDPSVELQLVRIVQEALSNIRKHSRAHQARVEMAAVGDSFRVDIEDDGTGFEPASIGRTRFPRFGLSTMRERADSIQATLEVTSSPGRGTRVRLEIPRNPSSDQQIEA